MKKTLLLLLFVVGILFHLSFFVYRIALQAISEGASVNPEASAPEQLPLSAAISMRLLPNNVSNPQNFSQGRSCKCASLDECLCCRSNPHASLAGDICLNASFNHHYRVS